MDKSTLISVAALVVFSAIAVILGVTLFFQLRKLRSAPPLINISRSYIPVRSDSDAELILEQLNEQLTAVIQSFPLRVSKGDGVYISRSNCNAPGIHLKDAGDASHTVSRMHAVISVDELGFFIQDNASANGMFVYGDPTPRDELSIRDGLIVCLGDQPVRFRIPEKGKTRTAKNEYSPGTGTKGDRT